MAPFSFTSGGGSSTPANDDWVTVDLTDGWTLNDPDSTVVGSASHAGGKNTVTVDTTSNATYIGGAIYWKKITKPDGSDFDLTKPIDVRLHLDLTDSGWADTGGASGGTGNPATGSRTYCLIGLMTDPENLPTSGVTPIPRDILGIGLEWQTSTTRLYRSILRNVSNSGTHGSIDTNKAGLKNITATDVAASHKASNKVEASFEIVKAEHLAAGSLDPAGAPRTYYVVWADRYDNGDRRNINQYSADQRWGRTRTDALYIWMGFGRGSSGASANSTVAVNAYYSVRQLDGGNNPGGTSGL